MYSQKAENGAQNNDFNIQHKLVSKKYQILKSKTDIHAK